MRQLRHRTDLLGVPVESGQVFGDLAKGPVRAAVLVPLGRLDGGVPQYEGPPEPAHAAQAVGKAVGQNPLSIVIPCHRVIGKNGSLTGYAGGLKRKQFLLDLEQPVGARLF